MLGRITRELEEVIDRYQSASFVCDFKYDGQRAQIHRDREGKIHIFSRHLENITEKYPGTFDVTIFPIFDSEG